MKALIQRVNEVEVWIDNSLHSNTGRGLLILFGTHKDDQPGSSGYLADKAVNLRIFEDAEGKMNLSALDISAEIMIVSQFTLYADTKKGRRPAFGDAMAPDKAEKMYDNFVKLTEASGLRVETGVFGAKMELKFVNSGPVTIMLEHGI